MCGRIHYVKINIFHSVKTSDDHVRKNVELLAHGSKGGIQGHAKRCLMENVKMRPEKWDKVA